MAADSAFSNSSRSREKRTTKEWKEVVTFLPLSFLSMYYFWNSQCYPFRWEIRITFLNLFQAINFYRADGMAEMEWYFSGRLLDSFPFLQWVRLHICEDVLFSKDFEPFLSVRLQDNVKVSGLRLCRPGVYHGGNRLVTVDWVLYVKWFSYSEYQIKSHWLFINFYKHAEYLLWVGSDHSSDQGHLNF